MGYKNLEKKRQYDREWGKKRRNDWIVSQGGKCVQCGSTDNLEVDHIDPLTKELNPRALWGMSETNERRIKELAKCQVLCFGCHQLKTINEKIRPIKHGTHNAYASKGCRCKECTKAHAVYNASLKLQR